MVTNSNYSDALESVRSDRKLSLADLASATGISLEKLKKYEAGPDEPSVAELKKIAKALSIPSVMLGPIKPTPTSQGITDFRTFSGSVATVSFQTTNTISDARALLSNVKKVADEYDGIIDIQKIPKASLNTNPVTLARSQRNYLKFSNEEQLDTDRDIRHLATLRARIEALGIFVIAKSFPLEDGRGFCLVEPNAPPIIVLNRTEKVEGARLFTLIHEYCHVLLRQEGISDYSVNKHNIEKFCNNFAAEFLMPAELVHELSENNFTPGDYNNDLIKNISEVLQVSRQAIALRLQETNVAPKTFYRFWLRQFGNKKPEEIEPGIRRSTVAGRKIAEHGILMTEFAAKAIQKGALSSLDIYRLTKIKPKYLQDALEAARKRKDQAGVL